MWRSRPETSANLEIRHAAHQIKEERHVLFTKECLKVFCGANNPQLRVAISNNIPAKKRCFLLKIYNLILKKLDFLFWNRSATMTL